MECKICLSDGLLTSPNRLIDPCRCSGSVRYVHIRCLKRWQEISGNYSRCTVCRAEYVIPEPEHLEVIQSVYTPDAPWGVYALFITYTLIVVIIFRPKDEKFTEKLLLVGHAVYTIFNLSLYAQMLSQLQVPNRWLYLQKARRHAWIPAVHIAAVYGIINADIVFCLPATLFPDLYVVRHIEIIDEINAHLRRD